MSEETKSCPICGEEIKSVAKKCIHCDEFIEPRAVAEDKTPCPKCFVPVSGEAKKCVHCGEFIRSHSKWSDWWQTSVAEIKVDKTLWDLVSLFFVPIVLAVLAFMLNQWATHRQNVSDGRRATAEAEVEKDRSGDAVLRAYLDRMSELMLDHKLGTPEEEEGAVRLIAQARTLAAMQGLDPLRQGILVDFLGQSGLQTLLSGADLSGADLRGANLSGVDLSGSNLSWIDLSEANLSGSNLRGVDLSGVDLRETDLSWADLSGANLSGIDLREANLSGSNLSEANLSRAILSGAILSETDLRGADLRAADLTGAKYDDNTQWPDGFDPEAAGAEKLD